MPLTITFSIQGTIGKDEVFLNGAFEIPEAVGAQIAAAAGTSVKQAQPVTQPDSFGPAQAGDDSGAFDDDSAARRRKPGNMRVVVATQYVLTGKSIAFWNMGRKYAEVTINDKSPLWASWVTPRMTHFVKDGEMHELPAPVKMTLLVSDKKNGKGNYYEDVVKIERATE